MRAITTILVILTALTLALPASAQFGRWNDDGGEDFEFMVRAGKFKPFIEANYGLARPSYEGLKGSFNTLGVAELKVGFASLDSLRSALVGLDERYAFASYFSEDIRPSNAPAEGEIQSELTRFGFGNRLGYGYGWNVMRLDLYNQNSLNWTKVLPIGYDDMAPDAQAVFDRYGTSYRFGQLMEAGVKVSLVRSISVSAGVEGAVIFPRTVFWPWLGSAMIYSGTQGALQFFSEQIVNSSPVIGPLLFFVLKSGVSLGYYMMMREDMNWPFESETPLTVESAKLGASITF